MRERKVLFSDAAWALVQKEARRQGVSAGQFVREAAVAWMVLNRAQETDSELELMRQVIEQLREP